VKILTDDSNEKDVGSLGEIFVLGLQVLPHLRDNSGFILKGQLHGMFANIPIMLF
jgi:hypothetical protein